MAKTVNESTATELYGEAPAYGPWQRETPGRVSADTDGKVSEVESMGTEAASKDFNLGDAGRSDSVSGGGNQYGKSVWSPRIP